MDARGKKFTDPIEVSIEISGVPYQGEYVVDKELLIVYADGFGTETAGRSATPDHIIAQSVLRSIIQKGRKS